MLMMRVFLQCARHLSCPLITLDKRMEKIADELNIEIVELMK